MSPPSERDAGLTALIVAKGFHPVSHSGTIRVASLCRHLPSLGVRPVVLTDQLADGANRTATTFVPGGDGDGGGPSVLRVPWTHVASTTWPRLRKLPLLSGAVDRLRRARLSRAAIAGLSRLSGRDRPDLVFASGPPGDALVIGEAVSRDLGVPFLADYRDPWSHWPMPFYPHAIDFLAERAVEAALVPRCGRILTTCEAARTLLIESLGGDPRRIVVVPNGYDEEEFQGAEHLLPERPDLFTIVYSGAIGRTSIPSAQERLARRLGFGYDPLQTNYNARSLFYYLHGLRRFCDATPEARGRVRLCVVGVAAAEAERDPAIRTFPYRELLEFYPRVRPQLAVGACLQADLLLLTQLETTYRGQPFCMAIPAKLYTYLRSGRRILACAQRSEISDLIEAESAGVTVSAHDPAAMAEATAAEFQRWSRGDAPRNPPMRACRQYERQEIASRVAQVMEEVLAERRRSAAPPMPTASAEAVGT